MNRQVETNNSTPNHGSRRGARGRKALAVEERQSQVAALFKTGASQGAIAHQLGCSQTTVSRDVQAIRERYATTTREQHADHVARQLLELDWVEREARAAWEKSKSDKIVMEQSQDLDADDAPADATEPAGDGALVMKRSRRRGRMRKVQREGDAKWLNVIANVTAQKAKLLGLDRGAPPAEADDDQGDWDYVATTHEERVEAALDFLYSAEGRPFLSALERGLADGPTKPRALLTDGDDEIVDYVVDDDGNATRIN